MMTGTTTAAIKTRLVSIARIVTAGDDSSSTGSKVQAGIDHSDVISVPLTPAPIPGSRSEGSPTFVARLLSPARQRAIAAYREVAQAHGLDMAHMALAFAAQQPFMASVLMAASNAEQLASNLGAIDLVLPKEVVSAINQVHDAHPNPK